MTRFIASLLIFVFLASLLIFPISVYAQAQFWPGTKVLVPGSGKILSTGVGTGTFTSASNSFSFFKPCADPTSCSIMIGIQVFLTLFGSKLSCLFGSEQDLFAAGLSPQTAIPNSAYDNLSGIKSLTDVSGPFGGQILTKQECKCGKKFGAKEVMMIGPPRRTMVAVTSSTKTYDYRSFQPGNWVLGVATSQVVCRIPKALGISEIGTSK